MSCWPPRRAELEQLGPPPPGRSAAEPALARDTACKIAPLALPSEWEKLCVTPG